MAEQKNRQDCMNQLRKVRREKLAELQAERTETLFRSQNLTRHIIHLEVKESL